MKVFRPAAAQPCAASENIRLSERRTISLLADHWWQSSTKPSVMVEVGLASGHHAVAACSKQDLPQGADVSVFTGLRSYQLYEENKDYISMYGVRLVSTDGDTIPIAAVDLAAHSLWFRAYMRNR